jgi:2-hydroxy-3-keto-5-methylthiopentenyl-1-phosphate phosphatase
MTRPLSELAEIIVLQCEVAPAVRERAEWLRDRGVPVVVP